jgi:hypothetical protein
MIHTGMWILTGCADTRPLTQFARLSSLVPTYVCLLQTWVMAAEWCPNFLQWFYTPFFGLDRWIADILHNAPLCVKIMSARLTLHSTKLCTKFKIYRKKIFFGSKVTSETFLSISQNLKFTRLHRGTQTKLWTCWRNFDISRSFARFLRLVHGFAVFQQMV